MAITTVSKRNNIKDLILALKQAERDGWQVDEFSVENHLRELPGDFWVSYEYSGTATVTAHMVLKTKEMKQPKKPNGKKKPAPKMPMGGKMPKKPKC